ncbi:MAG: TVP38/TMEM64 family protein, partial [Bacteroidales bacterium]|nr:TVP38/TMEM64 family protein [Bacteroidales bacterium]
MNDLKPEKNAKQSKLPLIISGIIIVGVMTSYFTIPDVKNFLQQAYNILTSGNEKRISDWVDQLGFWGPFFIIAGMSLQMFLLIIPSPLLIVVSVVAYGPYWGTLIAVSAIFIASTIGFYVGKLLGEATVERLIGHKKRKKIEFYVERYSGWAVFITRLAPLLSNDAISFVAGILHIKYWKFIA